MAKSQQLSIDKNLAFKLLKDCLVPRDKLPYTEKFEQLYNDYCDQSNRKPTKQAVMQEFFNLAKKGGFAGKKSTRKCPDYNIRQAVFIGKKMKRSLSARASIVYTQEFENLREDFNRTFSSVYDSADFWLIVDALAKKVKGTEWQVQIQKAKETACLAVEIYNKPLVKFRCGSYIVLMNIAWTALMHAIFFRLGVQPFYRDKDHPNRFQKIDDDYKGWELSTCLSEYFGGEASPVKENLQMFIGLRNKIEHRSLPALDHSIFGECQAMLLNFEDMIFDHFGPDHSLSESLALALQFSHLRYPEQAEAIQSFHAPLSADIARYIDAFRSSLSDEIRNDSAFSFRVFMIPKIVNRESSADIAVEYVKYDPTNPNEMEKYNQIVAMLKPMVTQVANQGRLKASVVCRCVEPIVKKVHGPAAKFSPSYHHVGACKLYEIRPGKGTDNPADTKTQFCHYDHAHDDYVYTDAWKKFLISELKKPEVYHRIKDANRR